MNNQNPDCGFLLEGSMKSLLGQARAEGVQVCYTIDCQTQTARGQLNQIRGPLGSSHPELIFVRDTTSHSDEDLLRKDDTQRSRRLETAHFGNGA